VLFLGVDNIVVVVVVVEEVVVITLRGDNGNRGKREIRKK